MVLPLLGWWRCDVWLALPGLKIGPGTNSGSATLQEAHVSYRPQQKDPMRGEYSQAKEKVGFLRLIYSFPLTNLYL